MKIAYIILAHRYPEQLIRLVKRLHTESAIFLIHIDKKVDPAIYKSIINELKCLQNVHFIKRFTCFWAGFGIVQATYQGIKELINNHIAFDYLILLSGQDYPIKTNEYIQQFLQEHQGQSFINFNPFPFDEWEGERGGWNRIEYWHIITQKLYYILPWLPISSNGNILKNIFKKVISKLINKRTIPGGLHPYGGAQFWCLHQEHVKYIHQFISKHPSYFRFFRFVYVPDEILFQTIIGNSSYTNKLENDTLHYIDWSRVNKIFTKTDLRAIQQNKCLFARKFDRTVDAEILDLIDTEILGIKF
ncbi:beta-1,6-N-acetylglucosaminyltransferase [Adhaeribacter pallidiroseus]|uniref:Peptide O-xylosyltransferase n=1 Tax=Adhaeribacter pallidiroseus TaxID=2072847 RepID=A0A369QR15_9BACT|nr:beta-1,6-N-acetylglucosaminyltransferase [Adhaeribacter pallidiroseus]RDC66115.1 hypothetical protein AHMF7616_04746 [Adhaeribacter pallidiroseus]